MFSQESLEEFIEVIQRPKFKKYFSDTDVNSLLQLFDRYGELYEVKSAVKVCRDPKDDFLLSLAMSSRADFLVTGDSDLLVLKEIGNTEILNLSAFLEKVK